MSTGKRLKRHSRRKKSALEDDTTEAAGRSSAAVQTDPEDGSCGIGRHTRGSHLREETSATDLDTERARAANQGHPSEPSSPCDTSKQGAGCEPEPGDDTLTFMVPGRIVQNVYPVRYQGTVLYIPTGGFLRPHGRLHKMRSEE